MGTIRKHTMEAYEIIRFDRRLKTIDFTMNFVVEMMVLDKIKGGGAFGRFLGASDAFSLSSDMLILHRF